MKIHSKSTMQSNPGSMHKSSKAIENAVTMVKLSSTWLKNIEQYDTDCHILIIRHVKTIFDHTKTLRVEIGNVRRTWKPKLGKNQANAPDDYVVPYGDDLVLLLLNAVDGFEELMGPMFRHTHRNDTVHIDTRALLAKVSLGEEAVIELALACDISL